MPSILFILFAFYNLERKKESLILEGKKAHAATGRVGPMLYQLRYIPSNYHIMTYLLVHNFQTSFSLN